MSNTQKVKKQIGFMAIDQYGNTYHIKSMRPRKWLLEHLGKTKAAKMYVDLKNGGARCVGYVIGGLWLKLYRVYNF